MNKIPEFTQGIRNDGFHIFMDDKPISVDEVLERLRRGARTEYVFGILMELTDKAKIAVYGEGNAPRT